MPFSSGTYTGLSNSFNDAVAETVIDPLDWNALFTDIETAINALAGDIVNVKTYGAVGDGVTNDTTAFNAAIASGKSVHVPDGTYLLNALTQITTSAALFGNGKTSILKFNTTGAGIDINLTAGAQYNFVIRDLAFSTVTNTPAAVVRNTQSLNFLMERCYFPGVSADWCVENLSGYGFTVRDSVVISITGGGIRLRDNGASPQFSYVAKLHNCDFTLNSTTAIQVERPVDLLVESCVVEQCANGINLNSDAALTGGAVTLLNVWFEGNTNYDVKCSSGVATYLSCISCAFETAGTTVLLGDSGQGTFVNCLGASTVISGSGSASATLIGCQSISQSGTFSWNSIPANGNAVFAGYGAFGGALYFGANSNSLVEVSDGVVRLANGAGTGFTRLNLGGDTSSYPTIKRNSTAINFRLADDSADCAITAAGSTWSGNMIFASDNAYDIGANGATRPRRLFLADYAAVSGVIYLGASVSSIAVTADGVFRLCDAAGTSFGRLTLGGTSSSYPSIKRSSAGLIARLADDSNDTTLQASALYASGDPGGVASTNSLSNGNSTTISTGVGSVKMSTANAATNAAWIKMYVGTTAYWVPAWTTNAP